MFKANFTYHKGEVVNAKFTSAKPKPINAVFESGVGTKDHNKLYNRDLPDQHPIDAITGLREALEKSGVQGISKFSATNPTLTTSGGVCTWSIVNSFATNEVQVQIFRVSDGVQVMTEFDVSASTIVVKFNSSSNITAGIYRAVVQG